MQCRAKKQEKKEREREGDEKRRLTIVVVGSPPQKGKNKGGILRQPARGEKSER